MNLILIAFAIIIVSLMAFCFGYFCWLLPSYTKARRGCRVTKFEWMGFVIVSFVIYIIREMECKVDHWG